MRFKDIFGGNVRIALGILLLVVIATVFIRNYSPTGAVVVDKTKLAKCLSNNAVLYVSEGCPHCDTQKELFGENFKYLSYIACEENMESCVEAGVRGVPTWIINEKKYSGVRTLEELRKLANC
jgi:glutaredoxin